MDTPISLAPELPPWVSVVDGVTFPRGRRAALPRAPHAVAAPARAPVSLDTIARNHPMQVCRIDASGAGQPPERARQLADIGFAPGERVVVLSRSWPGAGALVVLVGQSRFALRRAEAACVMVGDIG